MTCSFFAPELGAKCAKTPAGETIFSLTHRYAGQALREVTTTNTSWGEAACVGQSGRAHGVGFWHSVSVLEDNTVTHYIWGLTAQQALAVAYEP